MGKRAARGEIVSRVHLASIMGCSLPTVDHWVRAGCPVEKRGGRGVPWQFNTAKVREWREETIREDASRSLADLSIEALGKRELAAKTELAELTLAREKRLVAPIEEIESAVARAFAEVRANMRNIPARVATQIVGETDETRMKSVILAEVDQALEALADQELIQEEELEEVEDTEEVPDDD